MPVVCDDHVNKPDHLAHIFANIENDQCPRGELERLRCIQREARALKTACQYEPFEDRIGEELSEERLHNTLIRGDALKALFDLL